MQPSPQEEPLPAAVPGLVVEPMGDQVLVYHSGTAQAHVLNTVASIVFMSCEEGRTFAETAEALAEDAQLSLPASEEVLHYSLRVLAKARLVSPTAGEKVSRRQLLKRFGMSAALLPAVITVLTPTPAFAQSCVTTAQCSGPPSNPAACGRPACSAGRVCGTSRPPRQSRCKFINATTVFCPCLP